MKNGIIPPDMETNPDLKYTPDALKKADIICSTFTIIEESCSNLPKRCNRQNC